MKKVMGILGKGLKYISYAGVVSLGLSFGYLQYVNSQVGPIDVNQKLLIKHYIEQQKMEESQARNMYYWVIFDIAMMRILTYGKYSSYCDRLDKKIVTPLLKRYESRDILTKIEEEPKKDDKWKKKNLFKEIKGVRAMNMNGFIQNEYIVKEMRKQQKLMDTRKLLHIEKEKIEKIQKIHRYVCSTGIELKDPEVSQYVKELPHIQKILPGDMLHKIMFI